MYRQIALAIFVVWVTPVEAQFYNYSQWERTIPNARALYIAGAFDTLIGITDREGIKAREHYRDCMTRSKMDNGQLAENVRSFVSLRSC
jgi:hypothetical protein